MVVGIGANAGGAVGNGIGVVAIVGEGSGFKGVRVGTGVVVGSGVDDSAAVGRGVGTEVTVGAEVDAGAGLRRSRGLKIVARNANCDGQRQNSGNEDCA